MQDKLTRRKRLPGKFIRNPDGRPDL